MNIANLTRRAPAWLLRCAILGFVVLIASGCASVKHASELRRLQSDYNTLTAKANQDSFHFADHDGTIPTKSSIQTLPPDAGKQVFAVPASYYDLWLAYATVAADLKELNKSAKKELFADGLYANARVLELLAMKQRALYGEIVAAANGSAPPNGEPSIASLPAKQQTQYRKLIDAAIRKSKDTNSFSKDADQIEKAALTDSVPKRATQIEVSTLANQIAGELESAGNSAPVYPRNRFVLEAINPLLLYDNALVRAIRAFYDGNLRSDSVTEKTSESQEIVRQITTAEKSLRQLRIHDDLQQVKGYKLLARIMMLNNAYLIIKATSGKGAGPEMRELIEKNYQDYKDCYDVLTKYKTEQAGEFNRLLGPLVENPDLILRPY